MKTILMIAVLASAGCLGDYNSPENREQRREDNQRDFMRYRQYFYDDISKECVAASCGLTGNMQNCLVTLSWKVDCDNPGVRAHLMPSVLKTLERDRGQLK